MSSKVGIASRLRSYVCSDDRSETCCAKHVLIALPGPPNPHDEPSGAPRATDQLPAVPLKRDGSSAGDKAAEAAASKQGIGSLMMCHTLDSHLHLCIALQCHWWCRVSECSVLHWWMCCDLIRCFTVLPWRSECGWYVLHLD